MPTLRKLLNDTFKAPSAPRKDPYRKSRPAAKDLAAELGIEIEPMRPGFNVWPPKALSDTPHDPYAENHYAEDWDDVLERVQGYAKALKDLASADSASNA